MNYKETYNTIQKILTELSETKPTNRVADMISKNLYIYLNGAELALKQLETIKQATNNVYAKSNKQEDPGAGE